MLGKLMKHDFRALSRTLFPLQIGILAGGLLATLLTVLTVRLSNASWAGSNGSTMLKELIMAASTTMSVLIGIAIAASAFVTILLICIHFYRSFLCDEGYLTFTLPVSTSNLLWSKLLTGIFWLLINAVVICVTILIFAVFGTTSAGIANQSVLDLIKQFFTEFLPRAAQYISIPLVIVECVIVGLLAIASQMLELYFAIIVGGQIAKKHRILAAIGMYLLINMGVGIISSVFTSVVAFGEGVWEITLNTAQEVGTFFTSVFGWYGVLFAGLSVLFFLVSRSILKKNLNLQ
ncbi:MAG TPA: hypothetical protein P5075_02850 [Eubacteriales bacterium]|nr:hypothetical protein [Eubacteriales bacterium]